ncbi:MAG TPA: ATP-binding protein [Geobacteraceae bacterium]|nr:ATP-binding protein [Geobacteraceae bacterium]
MPDHPTGKKSSELSVLKRQLINGIVLLNLLVYTCACLYLYHSRTAHEHENAVSLRNLATVLERNIAGAIDKINLSLLTVKDKVEEQLAEGGIDSESIFQTLKRIHSRVPQITSLLVTDTTGDVITGINGSGKVQRINVSDRDYFIRLRDNPNEELVFGKPVVSRITGEWVMTIGRRLNNRDGSFNGVTVALISETYYLKAFSQLNVGKNGSIALRTTALELIARYPETKGMVTESDRNNVSRTFRELIASGREEATFKARYPLDNIERLYYFHRSDSYPLIINVGRSTKECIAGWRKEAAMAMILLLLFSLGSVGYYRALTRRWQAEFRTAEELHAANEALEQRVEERTAELSAKTRELQKSEERYRTVADFTSDWEFWISPEERFLYISPSCEQVTGYRREEFFADPLLLERIIHPDDLEVYLEHRRTSEQNEYAEPVDFRIITRDGEERWIGHHCRQVFDDDGNGIGLRASNRDITERKRLEENLRALNEELDQRVELRTAELERVNRDLESFCYSVSHELRGPLARIEGFGEALAESVAAMSHEESQHLAQRISAASLRLRSVIDSLLLMARLSQAPLQVETVDLSELARQILAKLVAEAEGREVTVTIAPGLVVRGDRSMLTICLENLLGNAVKYTARNPSAEVEFGETCLSGEKVFFVRDNGVGFNMAYAGKLFEPFCRLHHDAEFEGSGIGLPIVQRIIERHNGRIWADAREGAGATFFFTISLCADHAPPHGSGGSLNKIVDGKPREYGRPA